VLFSILAANRLALNLEKRVFTDPNPTSLATASPPLVKPISEKMYRSFWIYLHLLTARHFYSF
jgi:hypothetical protein